MGDNLLIGSPSASVIARGGTQKKRATDQIQEVDGETRHVHGLHGVREGGWRGRQLGRKGLCYRQHVPLARSLISPKWQARLRPAAKTIGPTGFEFDIGLGINKYVNFGTPGIQRRTTSKVPRLHESRWQLMESPPLRLQLLHPVGCLCLRRTLATPPAAPDTRSKAER